MRLSLSMVMSVMLHLAVVPIFVNVGAAIFPALIAPIATALALLLRPRQLIAACRRRPAVVALVLVAIAAAWLLVSTLRTRPAGARRPAGVLQTPHRIDWTRIALERIRRQAAGITTRPAPIAARSETGPLVYRTNYARTGHDGSASPANLKLLWSYPGPGGGWTFLSSPLAAGDQIYGAGMLRDVGGILGLIFCLDANTGQPIWTLEQVDGLPLKGIYSSPALSQDGKFLIIGQGLHDDADSDLLCLDASTGQLHWKFRTPLHIESSPAVHGDVVVAGAGAIEGPDRLPTSHGGFAFAMRISDGAPLWRRDIADPESAPAITPDGKVLLGSGFNGNALLALASDGTPNWRLACPHPMTGAVTLIKDMAVVGTGDKDLIDDSPQSAGVVIAVDSTSGAVRWQTETGSAVLGAIAATGGRLIAPLRDGQILAIDHGGTPLWRQTLSRSLILAGPAVTDTRVYIPTRDGQLFVLDVASGQILEKHSINDPANPGDGRLCLSSPTIAAGRLYIGTETGGLRCYVGEARP